MYKQAKFLGTQLTVLQPLTHFIFSSLRLFASFEKVFLTASSSSKRETSRAVWNVRWMKRQYKLFRDQ